MISVWAGSEPLQGEETHLCRDWTWVLLTKGRVQILRDELTFLENGGYRSPGAWRPPLIFEGSPTCLKSRCSTYPCLDCALLEFVPNESRREAVPCRHIPLNELGTTLQTLYRTATYEEMRETLREWLLRTIKRLEQPTPSQIACQDERPDLRDSKIDLERPTEEAGPNKVEDESLKVLPRWSVLL